MADGRVEFCVFERADSGHWQGIAGGGEGDESSLEAARREAGEEAGVPDGAVFCSLTSQGSIPRSCFGEQAHWDPKLEFLPEYAFGVDCTGFTLRLSSEHADYRWGTYQETSARLHWESNRVALVELFSLLSK